MTLTERRKQFLKKIMELFQKTNLPVHYQTIANALGVSKWTAYDVLKELERLGYLSRDYKINPNEMGRSHIVFMPTNKAISLFEEKDSRKIDIDEWNKTTTKVFELLKNVKSLSINDITQKILEEIPKTQACVTSVAYIIGLFIVYLKKIGGKAEMLIKSIIQNAPTNEMLIMLFVGAASGTIIQTINNEMEVRITELVERYLKLFAELADYEKRMLSDFFNEVLVYYLS